MKPLLGWVSRRFRPIALAAAGLGLGFALWNQREAVSAVDWTVHWSGLLGSVLLFGVAAFGGSLSFWFVLRHLTGTAQLGETTLVWIRSALARYVPSGALTIAVRVRAREKLGASQSQIWAASAYEQLAAALAGATVSVAALSLAHRSPPLAAWLILAATIALAVVFRRRFAAVWLERIRGDRTKGERVLVNGWVLLGAALFDVAGWVVAGAAVWVLVDSLVPGQASALFLVGAYSFSWLLGYVALPVPSGFGIREAAFIALLAPQLGVGVATVVALALRLADILGELLAFAGTEAVHSFGRRHHSPRALPS